MSVCYDFLKDIVRYYDDFIKPKIDRSSIFLASIYMSDVVEAIDRLMREMAKEEPDREEIDRLMSTIKTLEDLTIDLPISYDEKLLKKLREIIDAVKKDINRIKRACGKDIVNRCLVYIAILELILRLMKYAMNPNTITKASLKSSLKTLEASIKLVFGEK